MKKSEHPKIPLHDRIKAILTESNSPKFILQISKFNSEIESSKTECVVSALGASSLHEALSQLIDCAVVKEFRDREHTQFTREDFKDACKTSEPILECLHILLKHANSCSTEEEVSSNIKKICPKLFYLVSGNIPENLWTNQKTVKKARQVLQELRTFFKVNTCSELVHVSLNQDSSDIPSPSTSLFGKYHAIIKQYLTKENWQRNPFAKASFTWMLLHVKFPHLSDYLSLVLPFPLNMVDDFNIENKILGVKCLHHIMENISHEELRWYGRAEVVYEALKHQLYTKHVTLVEVVHPAMLTVLKIVEKPESLTELRNMKRCDEVFRMIVLDSEMENNLAIRRALTASLPAFIDMMGITIVRHMKNVISLVSNYLEIYDGPEEVARINALKILKSLLVTAWPRIPVHAVRVMKCLLKFLYDVGTDRTVTPQTVRDEMTGQASDCLVLLKMAAPDIVQSSLVAITETDTIYFVKDVLLDVCSRKCLTSQNT